MECDLSNQDFITIFWNFCRQAEFCLLLQLQILTDAVIWWHMQSWTLEGLGGGGLRGSSLQTVTDIEIGFFHFFNIIWPPSLSSVFCTDMIVWSETPSYKQSWTAEAWWVGWYVETRCRQRHRHWVSFKPVCLLQTFATFLLRVKESRRTFVESGGLFSKLRASKIWLRLSPTSKVKYLQTDQTVPDIELSLATTFLDFLLLAIVNSNPAHKLGYEDKSAAP